MMDPTSQTPAVNLPMDEQTTVSQPGRAKLWQRLSATLLAAWCLASPTGIVWAQTVADTQNAAMRPGVTTTTTGVPLINIAAPNANGISANRYQSFNVDSIGVILNNSLQSGSTVMGGQIGANPNFNGRTAKVILNEVVSAIPSNLNGPIAVYGDQAKIIIANPNGITCNGCSFLNTSHVALTTGSSRWLDANGQETSFDQAAILALDVRGGKILINGQGLSSPLQRLDLIAQTLQLDGATNVGTGTLNLLAGRQLVHSETLAQLATSASNTRSDIGEEFAIDATVLGAMTAGNIRIVSTAKGMGVRSSVDLAASSGDLTISADGQITLKNALAQHNVTLATSDTLNAGQVYAGGDLSIAAQQINNQGQSIAAEGNAQITAPTINNANGQIMAGGELSITTPGTSFDLGNGRIEGLSGLQISAAQITNSGSFNHAAALTLLADNGITNTGTIVGGDMISARAGGDITNTGSILGGGPVSLTAGGQITNGGTLQAQSALSLSGAQINNAGSIEAVGDTTLAASGALRNDGDIVAYQALTLMAASLTNSTAASLKVAGRGQISTTGDIQNDGTLYSQGQLDTQAANLTNTGLFVAGQGDGAESTSTTPSTLTIGQTLTNSGSLGSTGALTVTATTVNNTHAIETTGNLTLSSGTVNNDASATVTVRKDLVAQIDTLTNPGSIQTDGNAQITLGTASTNAGGTLSAGQDLSLTTQKTTDIGGTVAAQRDLTLNLGDYTHSNGGTSFLAGQNFTLNASSLTNNGLLEAMQDFNLNLTGNLTNNGLLLAGQDINITAGSLTNYAATIEATRNLAITAGSVSNQRGPITTVYTNYGDDAPANAVNCRHDHGYCEGTAQTESTPAAVLSAGNNLTIKTTGQTSNDASLITAGGNIDIQADSFANTSHTLTTDWHGHWKEWKGAMSGWKDHDENGTSVTGNTAADIQATGAVNITAVGANTNTGNIQGSSIYLAGSTVTNGLTDYHYQTPSTSLPKSSIDLNPGFVKPGTHTLPPGVSFTPGTATLFTSTSRLALLVPGGSLLNDALPPELRKGNATFLMDGYLENQALRQAALEQTGKASFLGLTNPTQEREILYQNAVELATANHIRLGDALTEEQQALLTKPILWYVQEDVLGADGKTYSALVPKVYLPQGSLASWANTAGGQLQADNIDLQASGTVHNTGFIEANQSLSITAAQLINEKRSADIGEIHQWNGKQGYWKLTGDSVQPGGFMSAADIQLHVGDVKSISGEFIQNGQDISPQLAATLGEHYSYTQNQDHINRDWVQVSKSSSMAMIVTIVAAVVLTCITAGAIGPVIGPFLAGYIGGTLSAAVVAGLSSAVVGTAMQLGTTGKVNWDAIGKGAAVAALTAGVLNASGLSGASNAANGTAAPAAETTASTSATTTASTTAETASTSTTWVDSAKEALTKNFTVNGLEKAAERSAISAGIQTSINGGSFGSAFKNSMVTEVSAMGSRAIGDFYSKGAGYALGGEGSVAHAITHAALAAGAAELTHKDVTGAAIGAAVASVSDSWLAKQIGTQVVTESGQTITTLTDKQKEWVIGLSGALGGTVSILAGHDGSAAQAAAENVTRNNYLNHDQIDAMRARLKTCNHNATCVQNLVSEYTKISNGNDLAIGSCIDIACLEKHANALAAAAQDLASLQKEFPEVAKQLQVLQGTAATLIKGNTTWQNESAKQHDIKDFVDGQCGGKNDAACTQKFADNRKVGAVALVGLLAVGGVALATPTGLALLGEVKTALDMGVGNYCAINATSCLAVTEAIACGASGACGPTGSGALPLSSIAANSERTLANIAEDLAVAKGAAGKTGAVVSTTGKTAAAEANAASKTASSEGSVRLGCPCCFAAGTPVLTESGYKPIEEIRVGEQVVSKDEISGVIGGKPVTFLIETHKPVFALTLRGADGALESFTVTDNHPFWVENIPANSGEPVHAGWVDSGKLVAGMLVLNASGQTAEVLSLQPTDEKITTYNLTVADYHTYFVGKTQVWVHNQCACGVGGANVGDALKLGETKLIDGIPYTRVGRWMSPQELEAMQQNGAVVQGAGGQTFISTNGAGDFKGAASPGSLYVEFDVPANSLLQGGKDGWYKMIGPDAMKSQQYMLQKKGGTLLPKVKNITTIDSKP